MTTPAAPPSVDVTTYEIFGMDPASVAAYLASMTVDSGSPTRQSAHRARDPPMDRPRD